MTKLASTTYDTNFAFLSEDDPLFLQLAQSAERAFSADRIKHIALRGIFMKSLGYALVNFSSVHSNNDSTYKRTFLHFL